MKRTIATLSILLSVLGFGQDQSVFQSDLTTEKKPWTHLNFANDSKDFQFAIVSDRTGSPREGVFEDAMTKLNLLMPEFTITVGDLIRGAKGNDSTKLNKQWEQHFARIDSLKMPFFHLAGNHDIKANNEFQVKYWEELFGATFYSFTYKDVLFLALFSNEGIQILSEEQVEYFQEVIKKHHDVRWTMVFLHHPLWRYPHMSNFHKIEEALNDRKYTVFAGHQHNYNYAVRNKSNYYVLASTGGGSPLLGNSFGSFDHITWVTMQEDGPVLANLRLDGILPHDIATDETADLAKHLLESVNVETEVFVDSKTAFKEGIAFITYRNTSNHPLYMEGRFLHNHDVVAKPSILEVEIPPQSSKTIELVLAAIEPFALKKNVQLEYHGTIGYRLDEYPDLKLAGRVIIPIQNSDYKLIAANSITFVDSYEVKMVPPIPGTIIRYTLNGDDPNVTSDIYDGPLTLTESTKVKARLFTQDGLMKSEITQLNAKEIKPGRGLLVEHYNYSLSAKSWGGILDYAALEPYKISVTDQLDPVKVAGKRDQFGLVYKGTILLPESGKYTFKAVSDDGIRILIDGAEVVSDPVKHKAREAYGQVELDKGKHRIEIQYFQWKRSYALDITFETPSGENYALSPEILSYDQNAYQR